MFGQLVIIFFHQSVGGRQSECGHVLVTGRRVGRPVSAVESGGLHRQHVHRETDGQAHLGRLHGQGEVAGAGRRVARFSEKDEPQSRFILGFQALLQGARGQRLDLGRLFLGEVAFVYVLDLFLSGGQVGFVRHRRPVGGPGRRR